MAQNKEARDVMGTVAHMKKKGTLKIFIAVMAIGALLLIIGSFLLPEEEGEPESHESGGEELIGFFEYKELLEREVEGICLSVSGVNRVDAVIFFSEVGGSVYAQNKQGGSGHLIVARSAP